MCVLNNSVIIIETGTAGYCMKVSKLKFELCN